jgi:hypothetical protein
MVKGILDKLLGIGSSSSKNSPRPPFTKPIPVRINIPKIKVPDEIKINVKNDLDRFLREKKRRGW